MTQPYTHWNVLPHGKLSAIDEGILTVVGQIRMPLMNLPRRMTVVRLNDSRLVVWSAIALDEQEMATLEAFGRPAFLIVPNDHHRLDARARRPASAGRRARRLAREGRRSGAGRYHRAGLWRLAG